LVLVKKIFLFLTDPPTPPPPPPPHQQTLSQCWYFEILETARRLLLTGVLGLIKPGSGTQLAAGMVITLAALVGSAYLKPFLYKRDNALYILTNVEIFLVLMTGLLMKLWKASSLAGDDVSDFDASQLGIVLITMNVLLVLVVLFICIVQIIVVKQEAEEERLLSSDDSTMGINSRITGASGLNKIRKHNDAWATLTKVMSSTSIGSEGSIRSWKKKKMKRKIKVVKKTVMEDKVAEMEMTDIKRDSSFNMDNPMMRPPIPPSTTWITHVDVATGNEYYENSKTGETLWDKPF